MIKKLLLVDDDESIVEVIQMVLEGEGYQVITSLDGDYLTHFAQGLPDLILLDILLMGKDGQEICRHLKSDPRTAHIPVVMLSAHVDTGQLAHSSGADDFLEKPFDVDNLIAIVEKYLPNPSLLPASEESEQANSYN